MGCQYEYVPVGDSDHYGVLSYDAIICADPVAKARITLQIADCGIEEKIEKMDKANTQERRVKTLCA
jgi:hypothetical protein